MDRPLGRLERLVGGMSTALRSYPRMQASLWWAWRRYARTRLGAYQLWQEVQRRRHVGRSLARIRRIEADVARLEPKPAEGPPVMFVNVTSSPGWISFTNLVGLLASWGVRMSGRRVVHWLCERGMIKCPQGAYRRDPDVAPPCSACRQVRGAMFPASMREVFPWGEEVRGKLPLDESTPLEALTEVEYGGYPLGRLCLPSLRHTLRRHNLIDDQAPRRIYRDFLHSAANIVDRFTEVVGRVRPAALVAFNGFTYPEAVAREVAMCHGIPVFTYEVGFRPYSAFFSDGLAPSYPLEVPADFALSAEQEAELDAYLKRRFAGDFTMGGIRFWPEMRSVGGELKSKIGRHRQVVSVFTNSVFDTSQVTAHTIFEDMFAWLGETLGLADEYPDTLFVVRSHPDEYRRGIPRSLELVEDWLAENGFLSRANVHLIPPTERISSYELMGASKLCAVYNSTVGLEAAMLGKPVVLGGWSKYSVLSFVPRYARPDEYLGHVRALLGGDETETPAAWQAEARRLFYYLFFVASLDLSAFVEKAPGRETGVVLRRFDAEALRLERSEAMSRICGCISDERSAGVG